MPESVGIAQTYANPVRAAILLVWCQQKGATRVPTAGLPDLFLVSKALSLYHISSVHSWLQNPDGGTTGLAATHHGRMSTVWMEHLPVTVY